MRMAYTQLVSQWVTRRDKCATYGKLDFEERLRLARDGILNLEGQLCAEIQAAFDAKVVGLASSASRGCL